MSVVATTGKRTMPSRVARRTTPAAALASLGIVYGDLGTSPLYTLLWALVITISVLSGTALARSASGANAGRRQGG